MAGVLGICEGNEAGWERWQVRGVLFQMEERLGKRKKSRSEASGGRSLLYLREQLEVEVDCPDWPLLWWRGEGQLLEPVWGL